MKKQLISRYLHTWNFNLMIKLKLSVLVLFSLSTGAYANDSYAQTKSLSLKMNSVEISKVIREIEHSTEFRFIYNVNAIDLSRKVSINVEEASIESIMSTLFKDSDTAFEIVDKKIILRKKLKYSAKIPTSSSADTQTAVQFQVSGVVMDAYDIPLAGATVMEKSGSQGAVTDFDGNFSLAVSSEDAILEVSYVGFTTKEVAVNGQATLNIVLEEDVASLDEVVVVGYGVQKKETLTGAVTAINADDIQTTKSESLINNIQGKMPGLLIRQQTGEPGVFDNMVSIRGYGAPLVVIDGIVRDGTEDLAQLNPEDVENISILKDASAAIYGMNAANGVIIVTTKMGQSGKAKFTYSNLLGFKQPTGMEKQVDAYTYRLMANEMQRNIGAAPTYSDEILERYRNNEPGYTDNDWIDMFMHDQVFQQQHTLTASGGSEKIRYFSSLGYTEDNGLLKSGIQYYKRFNFRSNISADLTDHLKLKVNLSGRFDRTQAPREDFLWTYKTLIVNDRGKGYHTLDNENHLSAIDPENKNAFALVNPDLDGYRRRRNVRYQTNAELVYEAPFLEGLTISALGAYDSSNSNNSQLQKSYNLYDYFTDDLVTRFGTDKYSNDMRTFQRIYGRAMVNYQHTLMEDHNFNITGVAEVTSTRYDYLQAARQYEDIFTHDIIDQGTATTATNAGYRSFGRMAAFIGRVNYDYKGKYLLESVIRYDGSFRYSPEQRWAMFPSISLGWRISEEPFIQNNLSFIDNLKLRVSYGESGQDAGNAFEYVPGYIGSTANGYVFSNDGSLTIGMTPPGVVNNNLSWVSSKISNIGLDFSLWRGQLSGVVEVFERRNEGLLASRIQSVPDTFGASFPQENINTTLDRGIEIGLTHNNNIGDFNYSVGLNVTYARHKQLHTERASYTSSWDRWKNGAEDRYTGRMWMYEYDGQYASLEQYETAPLMGGTQGNSKMLPGSYAIKDLNGDGVINESDQTPDHWTYGLVNPPLQFGLTLSGSYKAFDFSMLWQGAYGYSINYRNNDIWGYGRYPTLHQKFMDRWHTVDPMADPYNPATQWQSGYYPALRSNFDNTTDMHLVDIWRPDAKYIRLKSLEIGYSVPSKILDKVGLSSVRIFASGFNLLTFTTRELRDADPERQERDWDANLTYPLMKSYNIGLNVNF